MWNTIIKICRLLDRFSSISGLIKANDALGFMYKLEEYFEPGATFRIDGMGLATGCVHLRGRVCSASPWSSVRCRGLLRLAGVIMVFLAHLVHGQLRSVRH